MRTVGFYWVRLNKCPDKIVLVGKDDPAEESVAA